jgi:hypothetical protein
MRDIGRKGHEPERRRRIDAAALTGDDGSPSPA